MKVLLIYLCLAVAVFGQVPSAADPGIGVSGVRWYVESFTGVVPIRDPQRISDGLPPSIDTMSTQLRSYKSFVYEAVFKNNSGKKIAAFSWEHIFSALDGGSELKRHGFYYHLPFQKGKAKKVQMKTDSPPTGLVSVEDLAKNNQSPYRESVQINCILFDDKTTWSNPLARTTCDKLRSDLKAREAWLKSIR